MYDIHKINVKYVQPGEQLELFCRHCNQPVEYVK